MLYLCFIQSYYITHRWYWFVIINYHYQHPSCPKPVVPINNPPPLLPELLPKPRKGLLQPSMPGLNKQRKQNWMWVTTTNQWGKEDRGAQRKPGKLINLPPCYYPLIHQQEDLCDACSWGWNSCYCRYPCSPPNVCFLFFVCFILIIFTAGRNFCSRRVVLV